MVWEVLALGESIKRWWFVRLEGHVKVKWNIVVTVFSLCLLVLVAALQGVVRTALSLLKTTQALIMTPLYFYFN